MKALDSKAMKLFKHLTEGVNSESPNKCIKNSDVFMAVHVEFKNAAKGHVVFLISHYSQQGEYLMSDPSVMFFQDKEGRVYPYTYVIDSIGLDQDYAYIDANCDLVAETEYAQVDLVNFVTQTWFPNILQQQEIKL